MSLPTELLAQARHLAGKEPRRPRDASLRQAVSSINATTHRMVTVSLQLDVAVETLLAKRSMKHCSRRCA